MRPRDNVQEPATPARAGRAPAVLVLAGLAAVAWGLRIARDNQRFTLELTGFLARLEQEVPNVRELAVGGLTAMAGALLAAIAVRGKLGETDRDFRLPVPSRPLDRWSVLLIFAAAASTGWLAWLLASVGYSNPQLYLFFGAVGLGALAFHRLDERPRRPLRFDLGDLALAGCLAGISYSLNVNHLTHWNFTAVGDEGEFFWLARAINLGRYDWNPFNLAGVYGDHPVLDSLLQAAGMKAYGLDRAGWRMAEVLVVAASAALVYVTARVLFGRVAATAAGLVLGCSHYLMSFTRIAYNNNHCVLYSLMAMTALTIAWRTQRTSWLFLAGCSMGLCLYTFSGALLIWPLIFLLWGIDFLRRPALGPVVSGLILMLGLALVVTPGIAATGIAHLVKIFTQHGPREIAWQPAPWLTSLIGLMHSVTAVWVNARWFHHFTAGPLVDTVTGLALWTGLWIALFRLRRTAERLALVWFCGGLILIAYTSYSPQPFFTRLMLVLPAIALLAGLFARSMSAILAESLGLRGAWAWTPVALALASVPALNLHQLLVVGPPRLVTNAETLTRRALQEHPASVVVEVCSRPNEVRQLFISMDPGEAARFRFSTVEEIEMPPDREGPADLFPLYLVHERALVQALQEKLGEDYHSVEHTDPANATHATLFLPDEDRLETKLRKRGIRLSNPKLLLQVDVGIDGAPMPQARFDVAADSRGNFYIGSAPEGKIHKYGPDGSYDQGWANSEGGAMEFKDLAAIATGPGDLLDALDAGNGMLVTFDPRGKLVRGPVQTYAFSSRGLYRAADGDAWIADTGRSGILWLKPGGTKRRDLLAGDPPRFQEPTDLLPTPDGGMLVYSASSDEIVKLGTDDSVVSRWKLERPPGSPPGTMALDGLGHVFVTNPAGHEVLVFGLDGTRLSQWGFQNTDTPMGICVDPANRIYIADPASGTVKVYRLRS